MTNDFDLVDRTTTFPLPWGFSLVFLKLAIGAVIVAALSFLLLVVFVVPGDLARAAGPAAQIAVSGAALVLIALGKVRVALTLLVWATWLIVTTFLSLYGGVRGTAVSVYPLLVMLCGWLLGARSASLLAGLAITATIVLVVAEPATARPGAQATPAVLYGLVQITCIVFATVLISLLTRSYHHRLDEVERLGQDLAHRTEQAQTIAADLNEAQAVAHIGSWVYYFDNDRIDMSAECCRIVGLPLGSRGTRTRYLARVHPDDLKQLEDDWQRALAGAPLVNQHRIWVDNRIRWISQRANVEFDENMQPLRCVGTMQDVTTLKQTEDELRVAATAFEAQEGMVITDANQIILRINPAFTRVTGYTASDLIGKTPRVLSSGRHNEAFYAAMWHSIATLGAWHGEIWNRRKNGEVYPEWLTITAVKDGAGNVTHYVGTLTDITQRKAAEEEIKHLAFYDPLTRLPNRRLLLDRLQQALASSARTGRQGALLFLDIDNFKALNDTLGHDVGDSLLEQVAERLSACVREGDTVARFGGDEFVLMLADLSTDSEESAAQARLVARKILAAINTPYALPGRTYRTSASLGITLFANHHATPFELLKQADIAMYEAKAAGRNTLRFFTPQTHAILEERSTDQADRTEV